MDNTHVDTIVLPAKPGHIQPSTEIEPNSSAPDTNIPTSEFTLTPESPSSRDPARVRSSNAEEPSKPIFFDYQSLPSPPDYGLDLVDDLFGQNVTEAYHLHCLAQSWREHRYGIEVARSSRPRFTPSPVRRAYAEELERARRRDEFDTDEESHYEEDIPKLHGDGEDSTSSGGIEQPQIEVTGVTQPGETMVQQGNTEGSDSNEKDRICSERSSFCLFCEPTDNPTDCTSQNKSHTPPPEDLSSDDDDLVPSGIASTPPALRRNSPSRPTPTLKRRREPEETDHASSPDESEERGRKRFRGSSAPAANSLDRTDVADR